MGKVKIKKAQWDRILKVLDRVDNKLNIDTQVYDIKEACTRMKIGKTLLYKLMNQKLLHYYAVGSDRRISEKHIQTYLKTVDTSNL